MRDSVETDGGKGLDDGSISQAASTREAILAASRGLFARYGYAKTNIGDIAAAVGMSPANLYRYFRNKQAIGHAVAAAFMVEYEAADDALVAGWTGSSEALLRRHIRENVERTVGLLTEAPQLIELAEMLFATEEGVAMADAHGDRYRARLAAVIDAGVAAGEFAPTDTDRAAHAVMMGVKYFQAPFAIMRHGFDQVFEDLEVTLDLLCAGLRAGMPRG